MLMGHGLGGSCLCGEDGCTGLGWVVHVYVGRMGVLDNPDGTANCSDIGLLHFGVF